MQAGRQAATLTQYPQLAREDVFAAIAYGAEAAREQVLPLPNRVA